MRNPGKRRSAAAGLRRGCLSAAARRSPRWRAGGRARHLGPYASSCDGNPGGVPKPSRDGARRAKPAEPHAMAARGPRSRLAGNRARTPGALGGDGNPGRVSKPSRDGLRRAKPDCVHALRRLEATPAARAPSLLHLRIEASWRAEGSSARGRPGVTSAGRKEPLRPSAAGCQRARGGGLCPTTLIAGGVEPFEGSTVSDARVPHGRAPRGR